MNRVTQMNSLVVAALFISLFGASSARALSDSKNSLFLCKLQKTVRTLRIEVGEDKNCRTIYTKQGVDDLIGSGQFHQSCVNIAENVRKNLEGVGWKCREVQSRSTETVLVE